MQYGIPFCSKIELPEGSISTYDHFLHNNQNVPPILKFAKDNYRFHKDDEELIFHSYVDQTSLIFSTIRTIARNGNFDMFFIGYHFIDAYTHWYHEENKRRLVEALSYELKDLNRYGEILFFSDHGSTEQKKVFFVNKWLYEKNYLSYEIYEKLIKYHKTYNSEFPDQLNLEHTHVFINEDKTKFYSCDAFDAMIDKTDKATQEDRDRLRTELMETGYFNDVYLKEEYLDKLAKYYDFCPDIIPDAKEGVLVSCNIHPKAEYGLNMDLLRGGWHSSRGVVGCTEKLDYVKIHKPYDIYTILEKFVDKQTPDAKNREEKKKTAENHFTGIGEVFDQLGYF